MRFDNLKLTTKSLLPLALTCLLFIGVTGLGVHRMSELGRRYEDLTEHSYAAVVKLLRSNRAITDFGLSVHQMIAYDADTPISRAATQEAASIGPRVDTLLGEAMQLDPAHAAQIKGYRDRFAKVFEQAKPAIAIAQELPALELGARLKPHELEQLAKCVSLLRGADEEIRAIVDEMRSIYRAAEAEDKRVGEELRRQTAQTIWTMIGVGALAVLIGCAASLYVSGRKIGAPIARLTGQMGDIAKGDLGAVVAGVERGDEVGAMARALDTFKRNAQELRAAEARAAEERRRSEEADSRRKAEQAVVEREREAALQAIGDGLEKLASKNLVYRLSDAMPETYRRLQNDFNAAMSQLEAALGLVAGGARAIDSGSSQIAVAADDLARRTEQQAASLEETAAALEEITTTVKKSAEGAVHASNIVGSTKMEAEKSGEIVRRAVDAMGRIERSSQQIGQIIGVIDEIAFQTNLLALNAGVEAARAGEAGKGFAVVASEVRALAQRSAEAAKEIKGLISTSTVEVDQGVELVGATGKALDTIVAQVAEIDKVVADIAAGAREQATGLAEVNTAVTQMDQNTQKNAAMVEETTAASHSLRKETEALTRSVASFELGDKHGSRTHAKAPRAALKTVSAERGGGAARKPQPAQDDWEEF
ncbi:methyl-accepting chemotaxis protein [Methylosinus sp. sav-2]|uniref:methyl-accepting chemotaxis protein n=1 Tax=Methylosinus sp. sav-2 TaxID=2485168 RepID=UPI00047C7656|nr:methyl-accepting chemotaxis protein [Methylosinus sp. sav-2]TDX65746.1 methyl-accepting chemotaxis protein [Methylosinus sp. sav-2]